MASRAVAQKPREIETRSDLDRVRVVERNQHDGVAQQIEPRAVLDQTVAL